jgi:hypothetical protein
MSRRAGSIRSRLAPHSLAMALLTLAACASAGAPLSSQPFASGSERATSIQLIVQNRNFADARLYAVRRGARTALGIVGGKQDAEFTLDWLLPEPLRIEIALLAGPRCSTEEMQVDPGDIIELQIDAVFTASSACRG